MKIEIAPIPPAPPPPPEATPPAPAPATAGVPPPPPPGFGKGAQKMLYIQLGPVADVTKLPVLGSKLVQDQLVTGPEGVFVISNFEGPSRIDLYDEYGLYSLHSGLTALMKTKIKEGSTAEEILKATGMKNNGFSCGATVSASSVSVDCPIKKYTKEPWKLGSIPFIGTARMHFPTLHFSLSRAEKKNTIKLGVYGDMSLKGGEYLSDVLFKSASVELSAQSIKVAAMLPKVELLPGVHVGPLGIVFKKGKGRSMGGGIQCTVPVDSLLGVLAGLMGKLPGGKIVLKKVGAVMKRLGFKDFKLRVAEVQGKAIHTVINGYSVDLDTSGISVDISTHMKSLLKALDMPMSTHRNPSISLGITLPLNIFKGRPPLPRFIARARDLGPLGDRVSLSEFGLSIGATNPPLPEVPVLSIQVFGEADFAYEKGLPTKEWITLRVVGELRMDGQLSLFLALKGTWKGAFGIKPLELSDVWFTVSFDPMLLPVCPGPCGLRAIGMGGAVVLKSRKSYGEAPQPAGTDDKGQPYWMVKGKQSSTRPGAGSDDMEFRANAYFDFKIPKNFWFDFSGRNIGIGTIGRITGLPKKVVDFGNAVFAKYEMAKFAMATFTGEIPDGCSGEFPLCIEISPGFHIEAKTSLWGIETHVMAKLLLPPQHIPDFQVGFKLKVPDLVAKIEAAVKKHVPFANGAINGLVNVLKRFGVTLQKPYLRVDNLEVEKFSIVKFFSGKEPFALAIDLTFFGKRFKNRFAIDFPADMLADGLFDSVAKLDQLSGKYALRAVVTILPKLFAAIWNTKFQFVGLKMKPRIEGQQMHIAIVSDTAFIKKLVSFVKDGVTKALGVFTKFIDIIQEFARRGAAAMLSMFNKLNSLKRPSEELMLGQSLDENMESLEVIPDTPPRITHISESANKGAHTKLESEADVSGVDFEALFAERESAFLQSQEEELLRQEAFLEEREKELTDEFQLMINNVAGKAVSAHEWRTKFKPYMACVSESVNAMTVSAEHNAETEGTGTWDDGTNPTVMVQIKAGGRSSPHHNACAVILGSDSVTLPPSKAEQLLAKEASLKNKVATIQANMTKPENLLELDDEYMDTEYSRVNSMELLSMSARSRVAAGCCFYCAECAAKAVERGAKETGNKAESATKEVGNKAESAAKEVSNKAESAAKEVSNKAEKAAKEVSNKAEKAAKEVKNKAAAAANWAANELRKFKNMMADATNKAKQALRSAANAVKRAAEKVWKAVKKGFMDVIEGVKKGASNAINMVVKLFNCIKKHMPYYQKAELGNIYVGCMLDPAKCNTRDIKFPYFKVCLNKIGCLQTPQTPTPAALLRWLKNNVFSSLKKWISNYVKWVPALSIKIPNGISTKRQSFNLRYPNGLRMKTTTYAGIRVSIPDTNNPFTYGTINNFISINGIPMGVKTKKLTFYYPKLKTGSFKNCN